MTPRLRRRSTHGPSGTPTSAPTARLAAASPDTAAAPACRTRMAISGKASKASHGPAVLTANPAHSQPTSRPSDRPDTRQSTRGARAAGSGHRLGVVRRALLSPVGQARVLVVDVE